MIKIIHKTKFFKIWNKQIANMIKVIYMLSYLVNDQSTSRTPVPNRLGSAVFIWENAKSNVSAITGGPHTHTFFSVFSDYPESCSFMKAASHLLGF